MKALLHFFKGICPIPIATTVASCTFLWQSQNPYFVMVAFVCKMSVNVVVGLYLLLFRANDFYFYQNLGYTSIRLFLIAFGIDFLIWLMGVIIIILNM